MTITTNDEDTATEPASKRTRVDENTVHQVPVKTGSEKRKSPTEHAKISINDCLESLPTAIKPLAEHYSTKFLKLRTEIARFDNTKKKLAKEDFIPASARIKFELGISERAKEAAEEAHLALVAQSNHIISVFTEDIKGMIAQSVEMEIQVARVELSSVFCEAVGALGIAFTMNHPTVENSLARTLVLHTIEHHHGLLLRHSGTDIVDFFEDFKTCSQDPLPVYVPGTLQVEETAKVALLVNPFKHCIESLFVRPWNIYMDAVIVNDRELLIKEFVDNRTKEAATVDLSMDLDDERLVEDTVNKLVDDKVAKANKSLADKVNRLTTQLRKAKNKGGGAKDASAPKKKKKAKDNKNTSSKKKKKKSVKKQESDDDKKADGNSKGSNKGKKKNGGKSTNTKKTKSKSNGKNQKKK
jgi:hypothetical protein